MKDGHAQLSEFQTGQLHELFVRLCRDKETRQKHTDTHTHTRIVHLLLLFRMLLYAVSVASALSGMSRDSLHLRGGHRQQMSCRTSLFAVLRRHSTSTILRRSAAQHRVLRLRRRHLREGRPTPAAVRPKKSRSWFPRMQHDIWSIIAFTRFLSISYERKLMTFRRDRDSRDVPGPVNGPH